MPKDIKNKLYLSWEDALWDILRSFSIPQESTILVPSFFCVDVMNNMRAHGLIPEYYEVDNNLQPVEHDLFSKMSKYKPPIIVLFHAVGISNKLVNKAFIGTYAKDTFIIEDCVHRVTNPSEVHIFAKRHIIINSFRKTVPLQGSFLFGDKEIISILKGPEKTCLYSASVILSWLFMQVCFLSQYMWNSCGLLAEWFMLKGYNVIGDEQKPGFNPQIFADLYMKLDFNKIKRIKKQQVSLYQSQIMIQESWESPFFRTEDSGELRGYPIVMSKEKGKRIIQFLRSRGIYVRAELDDSNWSKKRSIIYLPLGLQLQNKDINYISSIFNQAIHLLS